MRRLLFTHAFMAVVLNGTSVAQPVILCIGDSITAGSFVSTPYPTRLANSTGYRTINAGVGREATFDGLRRINGLLAQHNPTHVLILFGANDINGSGNLRNSADALREIATRVSNFGSIPIIGTATPFLGPKISKMPRVREFNGYVRAHARDNSFLLAELEYAFGLNASLMVSDGFHPNDAGAALIAITFAGKIELSPALEPAFSATAEAIGYTRNAWSFMTAWNLSTGGLQISGKWFNSELAWNYIQSDPEQWIAKFVYDDATGTTRELQWSFTHTHIQ